MALQEDLEAEVKQILKDRWTSRKGNVVPDATSLKLSNDAIELDAVVLYADMSGSTSLVDSYPAHFAAEIYKAYLHCAAKIIRSEGGEITAYDGDRVMAVFIGDTKNSSAARCGLKINWARINIINPAIRKQYPDKPYELKHTVGVDASSLFVARTGVRGANDLVWVGRAANHAAKLCGLSSDWPTWITKTVYDSLMQSVKVSGTGKDMWEARVWTSMNNRDIYRSSWQWRI